MRTLKVVCIAATVASCIKAPPPSPAPVAVLADTIFVPDLGFRMQLPRDTLCTRRGPNRQVLSGRQAARLLRHVTGEWDSVTAIVLDRTLPLDSLVFHAGSEPFGGPHAACYDDLHVRLYVSRSAGGSFGAAVRRLPALDPQFGWERHRDGYSMAYGDYFGSYTIDYFIRDEPRLTAVLVLMYAPSGRVPDHEPEVRALLQSARFYGSE